MRTDAVACVLRTLAALTACALAAGCGGAPVTPRPAPVVSAHFEGGVAGGYQHGCVADGSLWLARGLVVEHWAPAGERSLGRLLATVSLAEHALPVDAMSCVEDRLSVGVGDRALGVVDAGVAWRGPRAQMPPEWPVLTAPRPGFWDNTLPGGRIVQLGADLRVQRGLSVLEQRRVPSGLKASTFDGRQIYAAGASGLWVWNLTDKTPRPIALPAQTPLPLKGAFRDGGFLWLRHADDRLAPYVVQGGVAEQIRKALPMTPPPAALSLPLSETVQFVTADDGVARLESAGQTTPVAGLGPVSAAALVAGGLVVADQVAVYLLTPADPQPKLQRILQPGSPTVAIYGTDERVYLVGEDYGLVRMALRRE